MVSGGINQLKNNNDKPARAIILKKETGKLTSNDDEEFGEMGGGIAKLAFLIKIKIKWIKYYLIRETGEITVSGRMILAILIWKSDGKGITQECLI